MVLYQVCGLLESNTDREPNPAHPSGRRVYGRLQRVVQRSTALTMIPARAENGAGAIARRWWGGSGRTPIDMTGGRLLVPVVDVFPIGPIWVTFSGKSLRQRTRCRNGKRRADGLFGSTFAGNLDVLDRNH
jgi:hypothetical protein